MPQKYYTFNPQIYPRLIWVSVGKECFRDRFDGVVEMPENANAQCDYAFDRKANRGGVFIRFESADAMTYGIVTHEALHAAMMIYRYIDCKVEVNNQEHLCYLAGWIAKCIGEVKEKMQNETNNHIRASIGESITATTREDVALR